MNRSLPLDSAGAKEIFLDAFIQSAADLGVRLDASRLDLRLFLQRSIRDGDRMRLRGALGRVTFVGRDDDWTIQDLAPDDVVNVFAEVDPEWDGPEDARGLEVVQYQYTYGGRDISAALLRSLA